MKRVETELCAYSVESVAVAALAGATRVELCASPCEGGTTPSAAAIAVSHVVIRHAAAEHGGTPTELSVMIRPRGGDFLYSDAEFEQMKHDVVFARECGADGVVFGLLTADGDVDVARTRELVALAQPMECTFHRAFDVAREPLRALEDVIASGCKRILTSGQMATAIEGIDTLRALVAAADGRIEIMAGSGVNPGNAGQLIDTRVDALHFSARAVRESGMRYHNPRVNFSAGSVSDREIAFADPGFVAAMVAATEATA
ncbi:MAG: copper homeostasis protein CutC [Alistipes sp.]|nr:copper homeostasis protein CutC [Alistipes sp.]